MITAAKILVSLILVPLLGGLLTGADRKITARMQGRQGPPLLQPFYDVIKLLQKEATTVNAVTRFYTTFSLFFTVFAVILFLIGQDLLLCVFAFTLANIFFVIMGYSGFSPFSLVGAERELIQVMCYEPMILVVAFGFYEVSGTFGVGQFFTMERPAIIQLPLIFLGLVYVLTIKLRKSPFDLSTSHHGHQEIVKGITTELTGICLAMVEVSHWFENVFALCFVYIFFVYKNPVSYVLAVFICLFVFFMEILIDNAFARIKWKATLQTSWLITGAAAIANFLILGLMG